MVNARDPQVGRSLRLWVWALVAGLLAVLAFNARWTTDVMANVPNNDPGLTRMLAFLQAKGSSQLIALEAWPEGAASVADARTCLLALGQALPRVGATPIPQPDPASMAKLVDLVENHLPVLLTQDQLNELGERLTLERLRPYLAKIKERISRPEDLFTATAVRLDVMAVGGAPLKAVQASVAGTRFEQGTLIHADGQHLLLPCTVAFGPGEFFKTRSLMEVITAARTQAAAQGVRLEVIGAYRHFNDNMASMFADFFLTLPLGMALILGVLYSVARSWRGVAAMYLPALLALGGAVAAAALCGRTVALPLIGFAASLLGVTVDYGIQMATAVRTGDHRHIQRPLLRSGLISACAFGALISSPVPALSTLGIMVVGGLILAYASARWLIPDLVVPSPMPDPWRRTTGPALAWCEGHPGWCVGIAVVVTLGLAPGLRNLHMVSDPMRMDGSAVETRTALKSFLERWGALDSMNFLVATAPTADAALAQVFNARQRLDLPPSRIELLLPCQAEQARRQAAWNDFWRARGEAFRADFTTACAEQKLRVNAFADSLARYRPVEKPLTLSLEDWNGTPLEKALTTAVTRSDAGWRVASPLESLRFEAILDLTRRAESLGVAPAWIASGAYLSERMVQVFTADLLHRSLVIALSVILAVAVLVRSLRLGLAMLAPPAVALVWTFGFLGWTGQELTPFAVLVAAFVGGIGIDCAVFLSSAEHRQRLMTPSVACIATTLAGTACMLVAQHPILSGIGLMLTVGMSSSLITCLLLTPVLVGNRPGSGLTS